MPYSAKLDGSIIRTLHPLTNIAESLSLYDTNIAGCVEDLKNGLLESFKKNGLAARACVADCIPEVMQIHEDVWQSLLGAKAAIEAEYEVFAACEDDECRMQSLHNVAQIVAQNVRDNAQIIEDGVKAIAAVYPEAYECTKQAFVDFGNEVHALAQSFLDCVKP